ncbi:MAG: hypothetical protein ACTSPA_16030 [Promethearchaeota archaeon]
MQHVRQIQMSRSRLLDEITLRSKNLFNVATYTIASKNILQKGIPKSIWIGDRGRLGRPIVLKIS